MKPLEEIDKNYENFKHQYMKSYLDPLKIQDKINKKSIDVKDKEIQIKILKEKIKNLENSISIDMIQIEGRILSKKIMNLLNSKTH